MITEIVLRFTPNAGRYCHSMRCEVLGEDGNLRVITKDIMPDVDEMYLRAALNAFRDAVIRAMKEGK